MNGGEYVKHSNCIISVNDDKFWAMSLVIKLSMKDRKLPAHKTFRFQGKTQGVKTVEIGNLGNETIERMILYLNGY
jgi:hypothetical protein